MTLPACLLDLKISRVVSLTKNNFNAPVLPSASLDDQIKKLQSSTYDALKENEREIYPGVMRIFRLVMDSMDSVAVIVDKDCHILYANKRAIEMEQLAQAHDVHWSLKRCFEQKMDLCKECHAQESLQRKIVICFSLTPPGGGVFDVVAIPMQVNATSAVLLSATRR